MMQADRAQLEKDVLYDIVTAQRECSEYRVKLARISDALAGLARGLRDCPELVTPLPRGGRARLPRGAKPSKLPR